MRTGSILFLLADTSANLGHMIFPQKKSHGFSAFLKEKLCKPGESNQLACNSETPDLNLIQDLLNHAGEIQRCFLDVICGISNFCFQTLNSLCRLTFFPRSVTELVPSSKATRKGMEKDLSRHSQNAHDIGKKRPREQNRDKIRDKP